MKAGIARRILGGMLTGLMAVNILAGCGSTKSGSDSSDKKSRNEASEKTITYWSMWEATEPQGVAIKKIIDQYTADTGVKVNVEFKGRTGQREGLQAALDAGTNIDMFDEDISRVNQTWGKYILNLEDMCKEVNYESTALPAMMNAVREEGGGQLKSIPYQPNINAFFYNKAQFRDAGITNVPTTFDEFLDDCQKLKDKGYTPLTMDDAYATYLIGMHLERVCGEEKLKEIVKNGTWDDPSVLTFAKTYAEMSSKGYFSKNAGANVWPSGQNSEFAVGAVSMYYTGSWLPNEVNDIAGPDFEWGAFAYPSVAGGATDTKANVYGAQCLAINKDSKLSKECFDLICRITQKEGDKELADESNGIPADINNKEWPALVKPVYDIMNTTTTRLSWSAGIESNDDVIPAIKESFQKLVGGKLDAQGFVNAMKAAHK